MKTPNLAVIWVLLFSLIWMAQGCKKGTGKDYGGYQTKDFTGTWTLKARLLDHDQKGFDSAIDVAQWVPLSAHLELQLNSDGTLKNVNNGALINQGNWYITERHNASDRSQKLILWPDLFGEGIQCEIENKSEHDLLIFYWTFDHLNSQGFEVYVRRGFWYVR